AAIYPHAIQRIYAAGSELNLKRSLTWMAWAPFLTSDVVFLIGIIGIKAFPGLSEADSEHLVGMMANHIATQHGFFSWAMIVVFLIGIIGIKAFPGLSEADSEQLVGMMANHIATQNGFFYWAMIILFGGIIAAIVSTADSVLLTLSSVISKDIYGRYLNKDASDQKQIKVGKTIGVLVVIGLLYLAWNPPATLYRIFILKFELLIQVAPAFILGIYWKNLHAKAVFIGMLIGTIIAAYMAFNGLKPFGIA